MQILRVKNKIARLSFKKSHVNCFTMCTDKKDVKILTDGSAWNRRGRFESASHPAIKSETPNGRTPLKENFLRKNMTQR